MFAPLNQGILHLWSKFVVLAWMDDELWCGQAQNGVNLDFQVKFNLGGQGRSLHKTIGNLTKFFYTSKPNLAILAWTSQELSCGQASDWYTHVQTDRQTDIQTYRRTDRQTDRHIHTIASSAYVEVTMMCRSNGSLFGGDPRAPT